MVFVFVGLSVTYYLREEISWTFIIAEFFIIIIGRFMAIFISYNLFRCCTKDENEKLSVRELIFISYAALIRGAIAFGLVTQIPVGTEEFPEQRAVESSTLMLVLLTTVIFGTFTSFMEKCLLKDDSFPEMIEDQGSVNQSTVIYQQEQYMAEKLINTQHTFGKAGPGINDSHRDSKNKKLQNK